MKKHWLLLFAIAVTMLPFSLVGQVTIADSPFLYKPTANFNDCATQTQESCYVDMSIPNATHRTVEIRVRYPRNAPAGSQLPFILWSHGGEENENGRALNERWGRTLTRAGYIVVHMSHYWTAAQRAAACIEFQVSTKQDCQNFPMGSLYRPRDANVVLASLDLIEQNIPELNGRIDRTNIAVAGWSYGSFTAMALAGSKVRFSDAFPDVTFSNPLPKIFLAMSPQSSSVWGYKPDSWREITRPVLFGSGAADFAPNDTPETRRVPFQSVPPGKKYELYIDNPAAIHDVFNLDGSVEIFSQWLASYTLAYFDSNLKTGTQGAAFLISNRLPLFASHKTVRISRK